MKQALLICCFILISSAGIPVKAEEGMRDVLAHTLKTNPSLILERQDLELQIEEVDQAFAFFLPSVTAEAGATGYSVDTDPGTEGDGLDKSLSLNLSQFLYRGGQTDETIRQQLNLLKAQEYTYRNSVQDVFSNVIEAAARVRFQRNAVELARNNVAVLSRQAEASQARFDYGELTRTDVAQSRSRLARARSDLIQAQGDLDIALSDYVQVTNIEAKNRFDFKPVDAFIPDEREDYLRTVLQTNPQIVSQNFAIHASDRAVKASKGVLMPQIELNGAVERNYDPISSGIGVDNRSSATLGVRASLPIFNRGLNRSDIRQNQTRLYSEKARLDQLRFSLRSEAVTQWQAYQTALSEQESRRVQLEAAEIARTGVYTETEVGTRTVLDKLDADQEVLDAANALIAAQRDYVIASYNILALMGLLSPEAFSLVDPTLNHPQLVGDSFGKSFGNLLDPLLKVKNALGERIERAIE